MKQQTTNKLTAVLLASSLALPVLSYGDDEVYELDDYVVTGNVLYMDQVNALKTPTPILNVPQSLSITTYEDISLRGFNSVSDIVEYTPGVNMNQGEGHRDAVVFRGVLSTADFFVDGVRDDVQYYRPLYNVEQVEILRGPNALLFGRGGAGGILNRVTKKAEIGQSFNGYSLSVDTFGAYNAQIDKNVAISNTSAFRLNAYSDTFENHRDFSDGSGYGVNPSFKFLLDESTTLDVSYETIDYDRSIDRGIPKGADGTPVDALSDIVFGDPDLNKSEFESDSFRAMLQHSFSDTLKGILNVTYTDYDKLYQNFYAASYDATTPDSVTLDGYVDTTERQNFVLSGNLVHEFEKGDVKHTVLYGAEFIDSSSENDRFNPDFDPTDDTEDQQAFLISERNIPGVGFNAGGLDTGPFTDLNDETSTELSVFSIYVQDEIELTDAFTVVLGARYDNFDIEVIDHKKDTVGSQEDTELTPRAGIVYKPKDAISLYASYSQTFVPQSGEQFANLGKKAGLDPDEYSNLEAGVKWNIDDDFNVTAAIFKIDQDIVSDDGAGGSLIIEGEIEGFEAQVLRKISDQWTVSAGYTYLDGETTSGSRPAELPEDSFSIWNSFELSDKLGLGLGAIYQGESTPKGGASKGTVPSFTRVDAAAYYKLSDNLRLQATIENLLDEEYYPHAYSSHQFTVGAPINAKVSISGSF
ncbi:MAG: TonB-dependent siderophore receptor [Puniceicoccaceae bacterium]|nr:TonB-dependent siderophore receptor [Puniceicoccaceae bacterium]